MMNMKYLLLLAIVAVIGVSCAKILTRNSSANKMLTNFSNVKVDEFQSLIADPNVQLLDVRARDEFDEGHIAGATLVDVKCTYSA